MTGLLVVLAGGLGAVTRFFTDSAVQRRSRFVVPIGTVTINVLGSLLLGVLTGLVVFHAAPGELSTVLGTGFCGGFTTFSTASLETGRLWRTGRRAVPLGHAAGMLVASVLAAALGMWFGSLG